MINQDINASIRGENSTKIFANAKMQVTAGVSHFQQQQFTLAKMVLVNASQILMALLKSNTLSAESQKEAKQEVQKALAVAEECNKRIELCQKQLMQQDPYARHIIETALIRKCDETFESVAGLEQTKKQLYETIIIPNLRPDLFKDIRSPAKGILFYGPPGNGKTLLAKVVANQIKCVFFNISASALVQKHLGEGEKLIKSLFRVAGYFQPAVIFIDEIDSILSARSNEEHEASRRLKTEFLISFDGVQASDQDRIVVIAATNRPQDLDQAVLRRFTVKILIDQPDEASRLQMIKIHLSKVPYSLTEAQLQQVVKKLNGYSASDIKAVVKEASMSPLRVQIENKMIFSVSAHDISPVTFDDFLKAIEKVPPTLNQKQYQEYLQFQKRK